MTVGIVVVSHSVRLAEGVAELAGQMARDVPIEPAGGTDDGSLGTSYDRIEGAVQRALAAAGGDGVVVLADLGSAVMTAETYLEFQDDDVRERVRLVDAPLVEGAVAAGVESASGASLDAVARVAEAAWGRRSVGASAPGAEPRAAEPSVTDAASPAGVTRTVEVVNEQGMHARPAATLVKLAARFDAEVTIGGADAAGLLGLLGLGLRRGDRTEVCASGPDAEAAADAIAAAIAEGFGEMPETTSR